MFSLRSCHPLSQPTKLAPLMELETLPLRSKYTIQSNKLYDMLYLLTAVGLSPGGSTHLHTKNT
jgi:hypothetical protein